MTFPSLFRMGFGTHPKFVLTWEWNTRHGVRIGKIGLPFHMGLEFYIASSGIQFAVELGSCMLIPYLFFPTRHRHNFGVGMQTKIGDKYHTYWWPK